MTTIHVEVVETSSLGDRGYLAHDGRVALVVDPQRDIDRILALAGRLGVRITHVAETHLHNDYVSGALALARLTGAAYLVAGADTVGFERLPGRRRHQPAAAGRSDRRC
ncbi:MBL fold metallo-hydrolase [Planomonospora sp. ID82291]|uniref:MBL fold metallo-hydrolase n=1 Tax=Planomonospora sp. ID82291 TaxID=2738136 RepID=UPI0035ABD939